MNDIYHVLVTHDFSKASDEQLGEHANIYCAASMGINSAIRVIGNLLLEITESEGYSGEEAMRDLQLIGSALRHLPRMAQALEQNSISIEFEQNKRKGAKK
ncbi:hypothetical protein QLL80_004456 [Yersinia enterocolitica]|uniref:Uncharacterized protein n=1 Tax=Yersinia enterocolitica TaxID=630 RepID=A0AAD2UZJ2_YEREN|nr:hypothetical protein [Yersinia enterocolitica]EKN6064353.1 hypothetical protein [Yersinia enterocolitica]ELI8102102.1 hypothetical protein [Yersinia enterocolitica]ELW7390661.1 hypothetical protein [Yersinia enterocolitica]CFB67738.1 Uncharacterised protein [Yersinia enterocolitica]CQQ68081.1 Uncharacterised protein [Yersinia enterocolitica]